MVEVAESNEISLYTIEELELRIKESEAEFTAGKGIPSEEAHCRMQRFIADL